MLRIKEVIKEKGTTVNEVAEKMRITQPALSSIINGNPTSEKLEQIASILNVSVGYLFEPSGTDVITCPKCGTKLEIKEKE